MKSILKIGIMIIVLASFSYGVAVGHYKIFPFDALQSIKNIENEQNLPEDFDNTINEIDVKAHIHIDNESDISYKRYSLIQYIWKNIKILPYNKFPDNIQTNIADPKFNDLKNLKQIDKLTTYMENDVNSIAYLFIPVNSNNKLIIYHHGHDGGFDKGKSTIQFFLENNFSVLAFSMPLAGMNNQPLVHTEFGIIKLSSHDDFKFLNKETFSPIKYFVEPILSSLNYVDKNFDYDSYIMVGISGGGWTTTLYPAIDERINQSYAIAGSLPIFLRWELADKGDYEQTLPELYRIADYLDLYIMSSHGDNRKFVQVFNKYDSCCFAGEKFKIYENAVKEKIQNLEKGEFNIWLDDTHKGHKISTYILDKILDSIIEIKG